MEPLIKWTRDERTVGRADPTTMITWTGVLPSGSRIVVSDMGWPGCTTAVVRFRDGQSRPLSDAMAEHKFNQLERGHTAKLESMEDGSTIHM